VDAHEEYFNALKARVEELKPLLQKIDQREAIVLERIELEELKSNSARLASMGFRERWAAVLIDAVMML
jgi:hypothetical protein